MSDKIYTAKQIRRRKLALYVGLRILAMAYIIWALHFIFTA